MGSVLLGIDLGTSGAKAGLFTPEGVLLGRGRSGVYRQHEPQPGWAEGEPEEWWRSVREAIAAACADSGIEPGRIDAVGLCVLFPAVVLMDGEGGALRPSILYSDRRSLAESAALESSLGEGVYRARSGNVASPGTCAATSMLWLRRHEPEVWTAARVVGFANTFLTRRLTGSWITDLTHAGLSGLVDIRRPDRWDPEICRYVGVEGERLPAIVPAAGVAGGLSLAASREIGLRAGIPVAVGMGDAACACFGAGIVEPGSVGYVAGSTDCVTVPLSAPLPDHRWLTTGYHRPAQWMGIGTITSTGMSVEWIAETFYRGAREDRLATLFAEAEGAHAGGDLLFLPYLQGERTPHWDARARAVFTGLSLATTRADLARSVLTGTALALRDVVDCLPERPREIRAYGGGMTSRLWTQLKADALGLPLTVLVDTETGSLGAALLGARALGLYPSEADAAEVARRATRVAVVEPHPERVSGMNELIDRYREQYRRDRDLMHALAGTGSP